MLFGWPGSRQTDEAALEHEARRANIIGLYVTFAGVVATVVLGIAGLITVPSPFCAPTPRPDFVKLPAARSIVIAAQAVGSAAVVVTGHVTGSAAAVYFAITPGGDAKALPQAIPDAKGDFVTTLPLGNAVVGAGLRFTIQAFITAVSPDEWENTPPPGAVASKVLQVERE